MCLILFSFQTNSDYPFVVAANRDEAYARPTLASAFWSDHPQVLAGIDEEQGGTWMGITRQGRFAAVTNIRHGVSDQNAPLSRGELTREYLVGEDTPEQYLEKLQPKLKEYKPFNLLVGHTSDLFYLSSDIGIPEQLSPGTYGLSNGVLNSPWPKVVNGRELLREQVANKPEHANLLKILTNQNRAPDEELPSTGVPLEWERHLSPRFIATPDYGTRASTTLVVNQKGQVEWKEQSFEAGARESSLQSYNFNIEAGARD